MNKISKIQEKTVFHPIFAVSCLTGLTLVPALEKTGIQVITAFELLSPKAVSSAMVLNGAKCLLPISLSLSLHLT